jgi:hypothetical protein
MYFCTQMWIHIRVTGYSDMYKDINGLSTKEMWRSWEVLHKLLFLYISKRGFIPLLEVSSKTFLYIFSKLTSF